MEGYDVPKIYFDSNLNKEKREREDLLLKNKSPVSLKKHITKKGSFLIDEVKYKNIQTGPGKYKIPDDWVKKKI